jgi:hypothetical protein
MRFFEPHKRRLCEFWLKNQLKADRAGEARRTSNLARRSITIRMNLHNDAPTHRKPVQQNRRQNRRHGPTKSGERESRGAPPARVVTARARARASTLEHAHARPTTCPGSVTFQRRGSKTTCRAPSLPMSQISDESSRQRPDSSKTCPVKSTAQTEQNKAGERVEAHCQHASSPRAPRMRLNSRARTHARTHADSARRSSRAADRLER